MLRANYAPMVSDQDQLIFDILVPAEHYLRQVHTVVDFERYRSTMAACYHATNGRPADDPVVLLKIGFLQTHYNLSDREVLAAIQVNVAFHYFLKLALTDTHGLTKDLTCDNYNCKTNPSEPSESLITGNDCGVRTCHTRQVHNISFKRQSSEGPSGLSKARLHR